MDSKYTSVGVGNSLKTNGLKRKHAVENIKVKKIKLSNDNDSKTNNIKVQTNGHEKTKENKIVNETVQDLQEARRQLPVYMVRNRLLEEIKKNETMILIGETGSGKTTQIPQLIHEQRLEGAGAIAVTQPRRVAAITIAMRVASEMNTEIGSIVGYSVRFEDVTSPRTKVKYLTDGMLLREAILDPLLKKYTIIVLDEAHERTVSTDVLFGIVNLAQKDRAENKLNPLKIIIMSATMDVDSFRKYFHNCPVIYLEGRTYPVTIYHSKMKQDDYQYAAVCTIFQLHATTPANHDFLVFLTGQEEIETVMYNIKQIAKEATGPPIRVCPLYAGLPPAKQLQVWRDVPPGTRKIILATNIAEASVTIPRIKCVIDTGVVKERTWSGGTGAERLAVRAGSQAAGWQRAGRAGRTQPGAAYRLFTADDFRSRPLHHTPEILRCPLASTLLLLIATGAEPSTFPLIDTPPLDSVKASLALLKELGAIDSEVNPKLTVIGKKMSTFPIEPKYSKVLLSAPEYNCLDEALSLIAVLSSENLFHTPMHKREEAIKVKQKFLSPLGDHITLLNVFKAFCKAPLKKQWCKENYLNHKNLSYACEVRQQLLAICQKLNMTVSSCGQAYDQLLKCLLCGLFTNCAWQRGGGAGGAGGAWGAGGAGSAGGAGGAWGAGGAGSAGGAGGAWGAGGAGSAGGAGGAAVAGRYVTAAGAAAALHPASSLHAVRPAPPVLLYTELLSTSRTYMLTVSAIQPQWLHQVAPEYARRCRANR